MFLAKSQTMGLAAIILALSTLLSRFMGLIRDKVISWQFGAGSEADMYFAAFVVPDIINYLLAGGFMSITLIPLLSKRFLEDKQDGWHFFSCVITWMALGAIVATSIGSFFAPELARLAAPGLAEEQYGRLALFMRLVLPAQIFFIAGSCLMAVLYLRHQFAVPALTPLIYNGSIILMGVALPSLGLVQGMSGYCVGVSIGAFIGTFLIPLLVVRSVGIEYKFTLSHPLMKKFIWLALPLMLGQTIAALDEQFLRVFGSLAGDGAVSLLNYAKRISQVPVALVGQAAAAASYPFLVKLLTSGQEQEFSTVFSKALRSGMGLMMPCTMWMLCLAPSLFTLIFYGGRMSGQEIEQAAPLLRILLAAGPCWLVYALLARAYYARTDTITPAVTGTILTLIFVPIFYFFGVPLGAKGIATVSAVSMLCYVLVLVCIWGRRYGLDIFSGIFSVALRSALCALPACFCSYLVDGYIVEKTASLSPILSAFLGLSCAGLVFLAVFLPLSAKFCPGALAPLFRRFGIRC